MDTGFSSASQKKLILMCGLPGAGKTTTAHRIREALGDAIVFSRDYIRNQDKLYGRFKAYTKGNKETIDQIFYEEVENFLPSFSIIILDATFKRYAQRQTAYDFALKHNCQLFLIECICNYSNLLQRLERQVLLGQKKFNGPLKEKLEYYIKSMQEPQKPLSGASFIQFDTAKNHIVLKSLQDHSFQFANHLIEILERPFDPSVFESFSTNFIQDNIPE